MSTGLYPAGHERALPGGRPAVAYAVGFDPRREDRLDVWDRARDAVGGDDFADPLPLEWVDAAVRARAPEFVLDFGPGAIGLVTAPEPRRLANWSRPAPTGRRRPGRTHGLPSREGVACGRRRGEPV